MSDWVEIGKLDDFPENEAILVEDTPFDTLVVVYQNNTYNVLSGICSHEDFELGGSPVQEGQLTCLLHMSAFDLKSGEVLNPPAEEPLSIFETQIKNGNLWVKKRNKE